MNRRRRTRQVKYFVDLNVKRECNIVTHKFEMWITNKMGNIVLRTAIEIVYTKHIVPIGKQSLTKM